MRHLLTLDSWTRGDLAALFASAERFSGGRARPRDGVAVLFFPPTSLRTRVSFEAGASAMGLQPITFPPESLDKDEDVADVARYVALWADLAVIRHPDIGVLERMAATNALAIVNAMTSENHPCEVLSDLFALSARADIFALRYLFVGPDGNIARAWLEAATAFELDVTQSCPGDLRTPGMPWNEDLSAAIRHADVVLTDGPGRHAEAMLPYRITAALLDSAPDGVRLAPCPPFVRGREVSGGAIDHPAFVGFGFKRSLEPIQQAVMAWALEP